MNSLYKAVKPSCKTIFPMSSKIIYTIGLLFFFLTTKPQLARNSALFQELKTLDSVFFERGFNLCDTDYLKKAVHKNLLFFHDQGGMQDIATFLENVKNNLCSKPLKKPIRKREENSLEVFPLYHNGKLYGVIQSGVHLFYLREPGRNDVLTSTAKFTHVWLLDNGNWLLKEVLSYDHQSPGAAAPGK